MTREQMIAYLLNYISTDVGLLKVIRLSASKNIMQVPDERLAEVIAILNPQP